MLHMSDPNSLRQVLTGSYHNYFRIYDAQNTGPNSEVLLQADKSAFKAKKIGGPGKGGKGNGFRKDGINTDTIDFNKKILHGSWHPRENTIAVRCSALIMCLRDTDLITLLKIAATNNLFLYSAAQAS